MVLSQDALEGIAKYKYKAGTYTPIDNVLNHYWNWVVEFLPIWMAPNLVTLIGTNIQILATVIQVYYSPHLHEAAPSWVYFFSAAALFAYQTLDAIDGKQARRTQSSSPLGQLFDHGCDAFCTTLNMLCAIATLGVGPSLKGLWVLSSVSIAFYLAQWEEYHTGTMSCGNGFYGVTEGQMNLMLFHLLSGIFGPGLWAIQPVSFVPLTLLDCLGIILVTSNVILAADNMKNVFSVEDLAKLEGDELGNKHVSKVLAALQLLPPFFCLTLGYLWVSGPNAELYAKYPVLFLFTIGTQYVFFSTRMIVSHMCKVPFSPQFRVLIPFGLLVLNSRAPEWGLAKAPLVSPLLAACLYMVFILAVYAYYIHDVVLSICNYLGIALLRIKPPKKKD